MILLYLEKDLVKGKCKMQAIIYAKCSESDLCFLFGKSQMTIQAWTKSGLPQNDDGSYTLSKIIRWREDFFKEQMSKKISLCKLTQKELIVLTGQTRPTVLKWTKEGLPRNPKDKTYSLSKFVHWIGPYYNRLQKRRWRKTICSMRTLLKKYMSDEPARDIG